MGCPEISACQFVMSLFATWDIFNYIRVSNKSSIYVVHSISFQTFFVQGFSNCCSLLKIHYVIAIHLMRWLTNFYNFRFKWTATAAIGIHPTKAWLSQLVNFKKSGRDDTLEERYAIELCFKLGKNATDMYGMLQTAFGQSCMNRASVFQWHKRFKEGTESVWDDERCGRSKEVNRPELNGQRVRVTVRVTMLRF